MSEWKYVRTNSKGKKIYRRNTNESLEFVLDYLEKKSSVARMSLFGLSTFKKNI